MIKFTRTEMQYATYTSTLNKEDFAEVMDDLQKFYDFKLPEGFSYEDLEDIFNGVKEDIKIPVKGWNNDFTYTEYLTSLVQEVMRENALEDDPIYDYADDYDADEEVEILMTPEI